MHEISWLAEDSQTSQGLCCLELIRYEKDGPSGLCDDGDEFLDLISGIS